MITTAIIYAFGFIILAMATLLPNYQIFPDSVFDAFEYVFNGIASLNVLIIILPTIFSALSFFLTFLAFYFTFKLSVKVINYVRGVGQGI